ncbi:dystrophin-like isoform X10 [Dendronephthya gigantea]|uniref:dystrophin-like isoform X10 n=1 Tax=Dendronephthya gigantea TaxID=151771 RepID=UPI00106AAD82|nr:dystrophin-like isoform X10 [Dendronephthya gigantea]
MSHGFDFTEDELSADVTLRIKSKSGEQEGIQKKTFTKWVNMQYGKARANVEVKDIFKDLRDGTKLITLLEILTGKKLKREKGRLRVHHLNNVGHVLNFLETQKVKLVNIRNDDIVNGNPKLTLGLLWSIISHYQLRDVLREVVGDYVHDMSKVEKTLLAWCKQSTKGYEGVNVTNLTSSWKSGLAFNALIHRHRPDLFDYKHLLRNSSRANLEHAFNVANTHLGVPMLLDPEDVDRDQPDKKSIMMYLTTLFDTLPHKEIVLEDSSELSSTSTETVRSSRVVKVTQNTYEAEPGEETTSSQGEWEDYNDTLTEVLTWLEKAEKQLKGQAKISNDVDVVKDQFHDHEYFMIDLTNHQSNIGSVLEFGNQLISEGLVGEKEEHQIREQMIMLNDRWEALRLAAMDRQSKLHEQLMDLQQRQIDELASWLTAAEAKIESSDPVGSDVDTLKRQIDEHKSFQDDLEAQQQKVNSLTHMVVVVDDNANDNATAELEEQLGILGERWSSVCKWTEERWELLQVLQVSWQQYTTEEARLNEWLTSKEKEIEDMKRIDASDIDNVHRTIKQLQKLEMEMARQQASFQDFNDAAQKVAENVDEDSVSVKQIQDQMEEFNERWNSLTSQVTQRLTLLKGLDVKLTHLRKEVDETLQWMNDTQTLLNSPMAEASTASSKELGEKKELIQSLDNAVKKRKASITRVSRKAEDIITETKSISYRATTVEQLLADFNTRWERLCVLLEERKARLTQVSQDQKVSYIIEIITTLEIIVIEAEKELDRMGEIPDDEARLQEQKKIIKRLEEELQAKQAELDNLMAKYSELEANQRPAELERKLNRFREKWSKVSNLLATRTKTLNNALESGPPRQYLDAMESLSKLLKDIEEKITVEFKLTDTVKLEEQLAAVREMESNLKSNQKVLDNLNKSSEKVTKSLSKPKAEQLRRNLASLNDKWKEVILLLEKRQNQISKGINQTRQFQSEIAGLMKWIGDVESFIQEQVVDGDPESLEVQLDQCEALQGDIGKLQRKMDSLQETGTYITNKSEPEYATKVKQQLSDLKSNWATAVQQSNEQKEKLSKALNDAEKLDQDIKRLVTWMKHARAGVEDDESTLQHADVTQERLDHYKEVLHEVSKNNSAVAEINTTANKLISRSDKAAAANLREKIRVFNTEWAELKALLNKKQQDVLKLQSEIKTFDRAIDRETERIGEIQKNVQTCHESVGKDDTIMEKCLRALQKRMSELDEDGPQSPSTLAQQLITKKVAMVTVKQRLQEYQNLLGDLKERVKNIEQILEEELGRREKSKKDIGVIKIWITKSIQVIERKLDSSEPVDVTTIEELKADFAEHENMLEALEKQNRELLANASDKQKKEVNHAMEEVHAQWKLMQAKFEELKARPSREMESEFVSYHGQILSAVDGIARTLKKIRLTSSEPREIKLQLDECKKLQDENENLKRTIDSFKRTGQKIMSGIPDASKKSGIEKRIEEVVEQHSDMEAKLKKKEQDFTEALELSQEVEKNMNDIEKWLKDTSMELNRKIQGGFPSDVDGELKWNKNLIHQLTRKMAEVQSVSQKGRELVDLSETAQLDNLEDRINHVNELWEDLSSLAEKRQTTLQHQKKQVSDFEKTVDDLNVWVESIDKALAELDKNEIQNNYTEARREFDRIKLDVETKQPKFEEMKSQSGDFLKAGTHIMEPYRRLLERRWDNIQIKMRELEYALKTRKEEKDIIDAGRPRDEQVTMSKMVMVESAAPDSSDDLWWSAEEEEVQKTPDDLQQTMREIFIEIRTIQEITEEIIVTPRAKHDVVVEQKIKTTNRHLDDLNPKIDRVLIEGRSVIDREPDLAKQDDTREDLLKLTGQWLRLCDVHSKKVVKINPQWYQFRSNVPSTKLWITYMDKHLRQVEPESGKKVLHDDDLHREVLEIVEKKVEDLQERGVETVPEKDLLIMRKKLQLIDNRFDHYKKPQGYKICVYTGDDKDAGTRANAYIKLFGTKGRTDQLHLRKSETNDVQFQPGQVDVFTLDGVPSVGEVEKLRIWHDNTGLDPSWKLRSVSVQDRTNGDVYLFNCYSLLSKDEGSTLDDIKCTGKAEPKEADDAMMGRHKLLTVSWRQYTPPKERHLEADEKDAEVRMSPGWQFVDEIKQVFEKIRAIENDLGAPELHGGDYEDFSKQEDKIKKIGESIDKLRPEVDSVFDRSEIAVQDCSGKEAEAIEQALDKVQSRWSKLNREYKSRKGRWENAVAVWQRFHKDIKDLTLWINNAEKIIRETKLPTGDLDIDRAKQQQGPLEQAIADHQSTVTAVNTTGDEIIKNSSVVEAEILRDKLDALNRRWKIICTEVADRRERFHEEDMEYEEFADECRDLTQWMNEVEVTLAQRDPSPADEDGLKHQLEKVKDLEDEMIGKEETVRSIRKTGQRLQTKPILSKPSQEDVKRRMEAVESHWQRIKLAVPRRRKSIDDKLADLKKFLENLEELYIWTSTSRDLLDTQTSLGKTPDDNLEDIKRNLSSRRPVYDQVNNTYERYQEESILSTTAIPSNTHEKWRKMNADWGTISRYIDQPRMIIEQPINISGVQAVCSTPDILITQADDDEKTTPWPKFDKAVSELHDWLSLVEDVIKNQRIMLGNVDEMQRLTNKQKQSVEDELRGKQYLLNDISEMSFKLEEETENESHKNILRHQIQSLKEHWHNVQQQSNDWLNRINLMRDLWRQYEQIKNELEAWLAKAEERLNNAERTTGNTVAELEDLLQEHKSFREEVESWRPRVDRLNDLGEELIREFPEHNPSDIRLTSHRDTQRYNKLSSRCDERKDKLQEMLTRLVQFHENMISALTWLTSAESKIAELDSAVDAAATEEQPDLSSLKDELKALEGDINSHQETFASLNENGHVVMADLAPGEVLTALQSKLDDMNDRWNSLNARSVDVGDKLDGGATEWRQLFLDLQEIVDWIERAIQQLEAQKPVGNDLETVNVQNDAHQAFKNKMNMQRLVIDRTLESGKRHLETHDTAHPASPSRAHLADNLRVQLSAIRDRWPKLAKNSDAWQKTLDEALRLLNLLEKNMRDLDGKLQEAENYSNQWKPVTIEVVQDQSDNMKRFHTIVSPLQGMFDDVDGVENNLRRCNVILPSPWQNRLDDLHRRWKELQMKMLNRENTIQENITEYDMNITQEPLQASVVRPWERAISANKVPYYINHKTETTQWDHPKMTDLFHQLTELNDIRWSAYRTAMKLRCIQKAAGLDMVEKNVVVEALERHNMHGSHEDIIGVSEMVKVLTFIFDKLDMKEKEAIDIPLSIDLSLNWLLNVYDSGRIGKIRELSFKVGLISMSQGPLDEKYRYLFSLVSDSSNHVSPKKLGLLLHDQLQIPKQLGEAAAFGGSNIEPSVRSCFERAKKPDSITCQQFLDWLEKEPQSVIWIPTLHRLASAESVKHESKCQICKEYPIVGLRFRCLKCFNYDVCQSCFFSGRTSRNHYVTHPMHQYCLSTTGPEDVKDFFKVVKNKVKPRKYKNKPPKHLGYLPVQTVMEGTNLETPQSPPPSHNQDMHNKLGMFANRLADLEGSGSFKTPQKKGKSLEPGTPANQPRSPTQILMELAQEEKEDLDKTITDLQDENKTLMEELSQLKSLTTSRDDPHSGQDRENDVMNEIKLLRQHRSRHESRVKVLEDHNRQLQQQLTKLKQLLEQPSERSGSRMTPASSSGSVKKPGYHGDATASDSDNDGERKPLVTGSRGIQDPELRDVMDKINTSFPHDGGSHGDSSKQPLMGEER